jgi:hypothetical protein
MTDEEDKKEIERQKSDDDARKRRIRARNLAFWMYAGVALAVAPP